MIDPVFLFTGGCALLCLSPVIVGAAFDMQSEKGLPTCRAGCGCLSTDYGNGTCVQCYVAINNEIEAAVNPWPALERRR